MSDCSISIIANNPNIINIEEKACKILEWLISLDIVKPTLSNCILSSKHGYAISKGAVRITESPEELPFHLITNGLEIVTEKTVFDPGEASDPDVSCKNCNKIMSFEEWFNFEDPEDMRIKCIACGFEADLEEFILHIDFVEGNLGFKFWNWPDFTVDFINEFKNQLECEITIVHQRI